MLDAVGHQDLEGITLLERLSPERLPEVDLVVEFTVGHVGEKLLQFVC